ncbi:MAG: zinc metalloprotease HtpX [Chloroflexi bacterium]|nr:zinc metalloprotease HtpX [Chloroflexota bacterium]
MSRRWYGRDTELTVRMFLVMFLLAALYLLFITFLWASGLDFFSLAIIAAVLIGAQYFFSDKIALWSVGAREVSPAQAPELHAMVERLAAMADMPKPKVALVDSNVPNAFATGRNANNSVIAVTTSLLDRLQPNEVQAVLAHELTHVRNRDVMVITLASFFAMVANFLMRSLMFGGLHGGYDRRRGRDSAGGIVLVWLVSLLVWVLSFLLIRALSRYREYAADRGAAIITGSPALLASALVKISGTMQRIPQRDLREVEGMNAFFIVPALRGDSIMELLSTHPSLERRIERLKKMEQEMETL